MYINLRCEMNRQKKRQKDLANHLGITEIQLGRKIKGLAEFKLSEAFAIQKFLNSSLSIDELFKFVE